MVLAFYFRDSVELHEIGFDRDAGEIGGEQFSGAEKFAAVMVGFGVAVSFEMRQAAVGRAVGVAHDQHAFGLMQANRHADLFEDEVLFEVVTRRSQGLGSAGDDDHIGALDTLLLQELSHGRADAVIEAAENGGVGYVLIGRPSQNENPSHSSD